MAYFFMSDDAANDQLLSHKIAQIFPLAGISFLLVFITALVGGLVSGLAALSGSYLRYGTKKISMQWLLKLPQSLCLI